MQNKPMKSPLGLQNTAKNPLGLGINEANPVKQGIEYLRKKLRKQPK